MCVVLCVHVLDVGVAYPVHLLSHAIALLAQCAAAPLPPSCLAFV